MTKNCATLIEQTHTKTQETLAFKLTKPMKTFTVSPPISLCISTNGGVQRGQTDFFG